MPDYREKATRGTPDFPFAYYKMRRGEGFSNMVNLHWHTEIEMIYILNGEATVNVSEERHILKAGDIFFINPEELHIIKPQTLPLSYEVAVFSPELLEFKEGHFFEKEFITPLQNGDLHFPRVIDAGHPLYEKVQPIIEKLFQYDINSKPLILADLTAVFCIFAESGAMVNFDNKTVKKHSGDIKLCISYMKEHYTEKITLQDLAGLIHMSENYFCSYFKAYTGVTPFTQLNNIRIKKAAALLLKSDDSVLNIAESCGFENVSFFIRKFKEIMGCTPKSYRKIT